MIDVNLLRQLGWSEELISEVTRVAANINLMIGEQKGIEEPFFRFSSDSENKIFFETPEINTGGHIIVSNFEKP
jgi:hypothetical protein